MAYIEKEPIIDFITKGLNNPDKTKAFGYDAIEILTEIEYAPTADVREVKHGEWIPDTVEKGNPFNYYELMMIDVLCCSLCGERFDVSEARNYCPYCGAKMGGKEE